MQEVDVAKPRNELFAFNLAKWSIFGILIVTYILVYFHRMAPGVVSQNLMETFRITGAQLGTLSALYFFVYAFMQLPSGVIADSLGTRISVISGNLVAGVGSIIFGMATTFELACVGRFFVGLGVSVIFVAIMKSNSVWFHEKVFGLLSGLTLLIGNLGSVLAAAPLAALLDVFRWRTIFIAIGISSLVLSVLGYLIVQNRPENLGFTAPNRYRNDTPEAVSDNWLKNLHKVVTSLPVWPGFWVQLGMVGSLYSFMGLWGVRFLQDTYSVPKGVAAQHMTVMLLSFAIGALMWGWLSDRIGRRKPIILFCVAGYFVNWLVLMYSAWTPGVMGYLIFGIMGLLGSGFVVTFAAAKEVIHPKLSGMAVSVVNTGCFVGTALMQPLFGYILDRSWAGQSVGGLRIYSGVDYHNGFMLVLLFSAVAIVGAVRIRETRCRNIVVSSEV